MTEPRNGWQPERETDILAGTPPGVNTTLPSTMAWKNRSPTDLKVLPVNEMFMMLPPMIRHAVWAACPTCRFRGALITCGSVVSERRKDAAPDINHLDAMDPVKRVRLSLGAVMRSVNSVLNYKFALALRPSPYIHSVQYCYGHHNRCSSTRPIPIAMEITSSQSKTTGMRVGGRRDV